jgi:uncharacterized membrane protein YhiD involved in acid resistance
VNIIGDEDDEHYYDPVHSATLHGFALGAIVGLERQWRQRMAGTRTTALVAAGASAFVTAGSLLVDDPSATGRVASYVVSGVGFLGAGVIFKDSANIRGLNTAATIWCSAAIGVLAGLGALHLSLLLAIAVLLANTALRPLAYLLTKTDEGYSPVCMPAVCHWTKMSWRRLSAKQTRPAPLSSRSLCELARVPVLVYGEELFPVNVGR